jgi:hypothetical protein
VDAKELTIPVCLQASCTVMSDMKLKGGDLLAQNCIGVSFVKIASSE